MEINVKTATGEYGIVIKRGALSDAGEYLDLRGKTFIVTDTGVPDTYAKTLAAQCEDFRLCTIEQGEANKTLDTLRYIYDKMIEAEIDRSDRIAAVGGGVVGDIAGMAAATYMRGIEFVNLPTTVLAQVDSSVGGKVAVDCGGYKNLIGAFYSPSKVIIDREVLKTLDMRQAAAGIVEAVKMAVTCDARLFESLNKLIMESDDWRVSAKLDYAMEMALRTKRQIVEADELERGIRRILNFGHTLGHGIEAASKGHFLHGECVAMGMMPMCREAVRERLILLFEKLGVPYRMPQNPAWEDVKDAILHDKKMSRGELKLTFVDQLGSFRMEEMTPQAYFKYLESEGLG